MTRLRYFRSRHGDDEPLQVVAAAVVRDRKLLLVSKTAAPTVFYLPGGKPEDGEEPLATLAREVCEELGVAIVEAEHFALVRDRAALEDRAMEMDVFLTAVDGEVNPRAEIAAVAWIGGTDTAPRTLAPAIRNHVIPQLMALDLVDS